MKKTKSHCLKVGALFFLSLGATSCGSSLPSGILTSDNSSGSDSDNSGSQDWNQSGSAANVREGTYSFVFTNLTFRCSDGSTGNSQGGAMQMLVNVRNGFLTMQQTAASSGSSQQKTESSGTRVVSATAITGPVSSNGTFVATSSAVFDDVEYGYMRVTYKLDGKFIGSSWSGKYDYQVFFEKLGESCNYSSSFSGALTY